MARLQLVPEFKARGVSESVAYAALWVGSSASDFWEETDSDNFRNVAGKARVHPFENADKENARKTRRSFPWAASLPSVTTAAYFLMNHSTSCPKQNIRTARLQLHKMHHFN